MAINYSNNLKNLSFKNFYGRFYNVDKDGPLINKFLVFYKNLTIKIKNSFNKTRKIFNKNKQFKTFVFNFRNIDVEKIKIKFRNDGYCYYENFLSEDSYTFLENNWPHKSHFFEPDNPLKNYKFAFRFLKNEKKNNFDSSAIYQFYNFVLSKKFSNHINDITGSKGYECYSIVASIAEFKSYLIPHVDTVADDQNINEIINIIFFVNGSNQPENSGGTGIYIDNEFKNPILIPKTLRNSVLIYNSKLKFFHGFNFMKKNTFRKAISFQFKK